MSKQNSPKQEAQEQQAEGLAQWRRENWHRVLTIIEENLMGIMSNPNATPRDKNEAARTLARMANILTPEKVEETKGGDSKGKSIPWYEKELTEDEREIVEELTKVDQEDVA